jgi:hypothetical protein
MAQRGIAKSDVELISNLGTEVEGGYLFREKDFHAADRELKRQRQRLTSFDHLVGAGED